MIGRRAPIGHRVLRFAEFELDLERGELRRAGRSCEIRPTPLRLLLYLVEHRDRTVPKQELLEVLWPETSVTDASIANALRDLRRLLADDGARQHTLRTQKGRGYRFVAEVEPVRAVPRPGSGFVGRERELRELWSGLEAGFAGEGRVCLIAGEPGIGKTRLAEELVERARSYGARALFGRCYETPGAPAFWPWLQITRGLLEALGSEVFRTRLGGAAAELAVLLPDLRERLPDLQETQRLPPEQARFQLFDGLAALLERSAGDQALLLVLDDLHWADESSLRLVEFVARELAPAPVVILGTYRDTSLRRGDPLERTLAELVRHSLLQSIELRGLGLADVARLMELQLGDTPSRALVSRIHDTTEGNPLYLREILQLRGQRGFDGEEVEVPQGVRQVIRRRVHELGERTATLLATASVFGRRFELEPLADACELEPDAVLSMLERAEDAGLVEDEDGEPGVYRFAHLLVQEVLHAELHATRRARAHRRVAEAIRRHHAHALGPHLAALAHQFDAGGALELALEFAERAARYASDLFAWEEAAVQYAKALDVARRIEPEASRRQLDLLLALGSAQLSSGAGARSRGTFGEALELARSLELDATFGEAALGYAALPPAAGRPDPERVLRLEEALARLPEGEAVLGVRLKTELARTLAFPKLGREDPVARALASEALATARELDDAAVLGPALEVELEIFEWDARRRRALIDDRLRIAVELGDRSAEVRSRQRRAATLYRLAEPVDADDELDRADALLDALRRPALASAVQDLLRADRALWRGELEQVESRLASMWSSGEALEPDFFRQSRVYRDFALHRFRGTLGRLVPELREVIERYGPGQYVPLLAVALLESGDADAARAICREHPRLRYQPTFVPLPLVDVLVDLGETASCASLYEQLEGMREPFPALFTNCAAAWSGSYPRALGRLAFALDRPDLAERHFESALLAEGKLGAHAWLPRTELDYGAMLQRRDAPSDRARARELRSAARASCERLGLAGWLRGSVA